ncbi:hypothetical protein NEHOM01_1429 [Nematocida homosporus]|uniref:uncharacterized protein n=1 Tax=Nematocida homosporus TaxID=1912981 RepID=UPI00222095DA|nr:uncharacterized protein NEHOM01_1429 [Nematocida homosporus]KAI5186375.1 hypothetical protein NEHOM01_1429 [Nematocida homosporus]
MRAKLKKRLCIVVIVLAILGIIGIYIRRAEEKGEQKFYHAFGSLISRATERLHKKGKDGRESSTTAPHESQTTIPQTSGTNPSSPPAHPEPSAPPLEEFHPEPSAPPMEEMDMPENIAPISNSRSNQNFYITLLGKTNIKYTEADVDNHINSHRAPGLYPKLPPQTPDSLSGIRVSLVENQEVAQLSKTLEFCKALGNPFTVFYLDNSNILAHNEFITKLNDLFSHGDPRSDIITLSLAQCSFTYQSLALVLSTIKFGGLEIGGQRLISGHPVARPMQTSQYLKSLTLHSMPLQDLWSFASCVDTSNLLSLTLQGISFDKLDSSSIPSHFISKPRRVYFNDIKANSVCSSILIPLANVPDVSISFDGAMPSVTPFADEISLFCISLSVPYQLIRSARLIFLLNASFIITANGVDSGTSVRPSMSSNDTIVFEYTAASKTLHLTTKIDSNLIDKPNNAPLSFFNIRGDGKNVNLFVWTSKEQAISNDAFKMSLENMASILAHQLTTQLHIQIGNKATASTHDVERIPKLFGHLQKLAIENTTFVLTPTQPRNTQFAHALAQGRFVFAAKTTHDAWSAYIEKNKDSVSDAAVSEWLNNSPTNNTSNLNQKIQSSTIKFTPFS